MQQGPTGEQTGTRDETYDVISIVYHALQGAENCQIYAEDAESDELRQFFEQAAQQQRQLAEQGKQLLAQSLQKEGGSGSGSAFGFGQGSPASAPPTGERSETVTSGPTGGSAGTSF